VTGSSTTAQETQIQLTPQQRAWLILLLSFAVFCLICAISGVGIIYFLFQSSVPLDTMLQSGKGTGDVTGQVVKDERSLSNGDILTTNRVSQSTIVFRDSRQNEQLVAAVTLHGETTLTITRTLRPRFSWSSGGYGIDLSNFSGEIDVFVSHQLGREFRLSLRTGLGDVVNMNSGGQYTISARENQVQVINRDGVALLIPSSTNSGSINPRDIPVNTQATLNYDDSSPEIAISIADINLVTNSTFQDIFVPPDNGDGSTPALAQGWGCYDKPGSTPAGAYKPELKDGRLVMRLLRADNATSNGETGCLGYLNPPSGKDVSSYDYLSLRATMYINYQSLSACGEQGSECPMMLRLNFRDEKGDEHRWYHGFYAFVAFVDPQRNVPFQCNSCSQEHEFINEKVWYTYDSENLFTLIPPDQRPKTIISVQFYASGHQYDVYVGEVALLAGNTVS
jgi:hypothetical protein